MDSGDLWLGDDGLEPGHGLAPAVSDSPASCLRSDDDEVEGADEDETMLNLDEDHATRVDDRGSLDLADDSSIEFVSEPSGNDPPHPSELELYEDGDDVGPLDLSDEGHGLVPADVPEKGHGLGPDDSLEEDSLMLECDSNEEAASVSLGAESSTEMAGDGETGGGGSSDDDISWASDSEDSMSAASDSFDIPCGDDKHCFSLHDRLWSALKAYFGEDRLVEAFSRPHGRRIGSYFSGMGSVEMALLMLSASIHIAIRSSLTLQAIFSCESSNTLQRLLLTRGDGCVFTNILMHLDGVAQKVVVGKKYDFDYIRELVFAAKTCMACPCKQHGGTCKVPAVDMDISGSPCRPWSRASGAGRLGRSHPDIVLFLAWCRLLLSRRTPVAIHENVVGFDIDLLRALVGHLYDIWILPVSPEHAGFAFIRRPRRYYVLLLRGHAWARTNLNEAYAQVTKTLRSDTSGWSTWVWRASDEELLAEENHVRFQRQLEPLTTPSSDWTYLLTSRQQQYLAEYHTLWQQTAAAGRPRGGEAASGVFEGVWDLGQRPTWGSPASMRLPTFRRGSHRLWSPTRRRWLTHLEKAMCMGFPVYDDLAQIARVPTDIAVGDAPKFSIGNAMHIGNLSVVIAVVVACVDWKA